MYNKIVEVLISSGQLNIFLIPPYEFRNVISSAGFDIEVWNDKTDLAQKYFSQMTEPKGEPDLPELGCIC